VGLITLSEYEVLAKPTVQTRKAHAFGVSVSLIILVQFKICEISYSRIKATRFYNFLKLNSVNIFYFSVLLSFYCPTNILIFFILLFICPMSFALAGNLFINVTSYVNIVYLDNKRNQLRLFRLYTELLRNSNLPKNSRVMCYLLFSFSYSLLV
jgi:hypothetical protein